MYKLKYLPIAKQDLIEIVRYISKDLKNPIAASQLAEELVKAGDSILEFPYAHPAYIPIRPLNHEYRKFPVKNYLMLYWVDEKEKTITIARVIYSKRNYQQLLE